MKLRHVEVFHAIMLTGTINGAAKLLNVTQPAVTKILMHAEDQLGFKLFVRNKGRIIPTSEASTLSVEVAKVFAGLNDIRAMTHNLRNTPGSIRIAVPPALCLNFIPLVISAFRKSAPDSVFEVYSHHYAGAMSAVMRQDVDLAIVFNPQEHPALVIDKLGSARFVGCFPASAAPSLPRMVRLSAFQDWPFIALNGRDPHGAGVKSALQLAGVDLPKSTQVNTNSLALALVGQGAGAAIIDEYTAVDAGSNVAIRQIDPQLTFDIGVATLGNVAVPDAIRRFRKLLVQSHQSYLKNFAREWNCVS